jgi:hypothetical protein
LTGVASYVSLIQREYSSVKGKHHGQQVKYAQNRKIEKPNNLNFWNNNVIMLFSGFPDIAITV